MYRKIDCFIPFCNENITNEVASQLASCVFVRNIFVLCKEHVDVGGCISLEVSDFSSTETLRKISSNVMSDYALICTDMCRFEFGYKAIDRMISVGVDVCADWLYSDRHIKNGSKLEDVVAADYQYGSLRDDFDFGPLLIVSKKSLKSYCKQVDSNYKYAGLYDFRLFVSRSENRNSIFHINEFLYTVDKNDGVCDCEQQFAYVDPKNRDVQIEMEQVCTEHLKAIGAYIPADGITEVALQRGYFPCEASVIIPVKDRVRTIADALKSALSQKTNFEYNVIVVDNHSTDGTTEIIDKFTSDNRCIHIIPERYDLGIGGCWNQAVSDSRCGRFTVQLDSDDIYSDENTLQKIVDKFYEEKCAMVVGSYRITDFDLNTIPPGIIDHREWSDENGRNNALRINGFGAPRAFFTLLLRHFCVPNTSYGEDYALGLMFSRKYKVGRIYDVLYICRRWGGNSDASLSYDKILRNNIYKDSVRTMEILARQEMARFWNKELRDTDVDTFYSEQLELWPNARARYEELKSVDIKHFDYGDFRLDVQNNKARISSTGAKVDKKSIMERSCFLCDINQPIEQVRMPLEGKYLLLVNPYPILPEHFTIPLCRHTPQEILPYYKDMMRITQNLDKKIVFYNGPYCGASAPDHMHFQAGSRGVVPLERDWDELYRGLRSRIYPVSDDEFMEAISMEPVADDTGIFVLRNYVCPGLIIVTRTPEASEMLFKKIYKSMPILEGEIEPRMNILAWTMNCRNDGTPRIVSVIILRTKHRPDCYNKEGDEQIIVSPGALDVGGMIILPREEDYNKVDEKVAESILKEVTYSMDMEHELINTLKGSSI